MAEFITLTVETLLMLAFIALIMERALEVFVINFWSPEKATLQETVSHCQLSLENTEKKSEILSKHQDIVSTQGKCGILNDVDIADAITEAKRNLSQAKMQLSDYILHTRVKTQLIALAIGILLGFSGLRVLEPLFSPTSFLEMPLLQKFVFRSLDAVLTGLAVAGGSDGMHKLIKHFGTIVNDIKEITLKKQDNAPQKAKPSPDQKLNEPTSI